MNVEPRARRGGASSGQKAEDGLGADRVEQISNLRSVRADGTTTAVFDTTPEDVLASLPSFQGPVFVDLDETLYLRNSTEDFLSCASPGLLALCVLRVVDVLKPWRLTGGASTRDVWRTGALLVLFPWMLLTWRLRAPKLGSAYANGPLLLALKARGAAPIIVTNGFAPIVAPLVRAFGLGGAPLIAARLFHPRDRRCGKLALIEASPHRLRLSDAMMISDSLDDSAVLARCARPACTRWPQAQFLPALSQIYLPGRYLSRVKRPGKRFIVRGVILDDFAFWLLASFQNDRFVVQRAVGLLCLLVSFWAIYERGYVENDRIGAEREADPVLSDAFRAGLTATPAILPWIWASSFGAVGAAILTLVVMPKTPTMDGFVLLWGRGFAWWLVVLLTVHGVYFVYNRLEKSARVWLYAGLQLLRSAAFAPLVAVTPVGAAALCAHIAGRTLEYYVYRLGGSSWPTIQYRSIRLTLFIVFSVVIAFSAGLMAVFNGLGLAILLWMAFRARTELTKFRIRFL